MSKGHNIKQMLIDGHSYNNIAVQLDVALSTISYHAHRLGRRKYTFKPKKHDWNLVQEFYNQGHTIQETAKKFDTDWSTIQNAIEKGWFVLANRRCPERKRKLKSTRIARKKIFLLPEDVLVNDSEYPSNYARRIILEHQLLPYHCAITDCQLHDTQTIWCDKPLVLHLDHINGNRRDHRLENLRWLCPNCHSQTETYCGRNIRRRGRVNDPASTVLETAAHPSGPPRHRHGVTP